MHPSEPPLRPAGARSSVPADTAGHPLKDAAATGSFPYFPVDRRRGRLARERMTRSHDSAPKLGRWETLGAWLHVWTPHRDAEVPPVPWRTITIGTLLTI